ncbi:hypothetical protein TD95_004518 [Thielaviopsis punctulata]|uniref:Major facilitator superfamily (MFS) profile domain-containing protein n=1 Tax=Thielaviopsis punctulata TaxID=72032 RepID=A0A0F4ZJ27_9PEZI|nr:hypothetical protein TD95_004518 [Thielaviopsis punctulata]
MLGVLPDRHLDHVPGTSLLRSNIRAGIISGTTAPTQDSDLKHDSSGHFVLVPQPTNSPKDPLNWPRWKKEMFTVSYAFGSGAVGAVGPLFSPAMVPLAHEFDVPLGIFSLGVLGSAVATLAVAVLFCNPTAVKIGKRPLYLITTVGLIATSFWISETAANHSFRNLVAARAMQGACMAPLEALVPASISDIWFVHERGLRMAIFNLGFFGGVNLGAPIAGAVLQRTGPSYKTMFRAMGAAFVMQLVLTVFFMPESSFHRKDMVTECGVGGKDKAGIQQEKQALATTTTTTGTTDSAFSESKSSYLSTLAPWSGFWDPVPFWKTLIRPARMLVSPAVAWGTLIFSTSISWLVLLTVTVSQIFSAPPYNFNVVAVGATNLAPFVAAMVATAISGPLVDGTGAFMSRLNGGIFEPEFRLPIVAANLITAIGFFSWGQSLSVSDPWPVPVVVCSSLIGFGIQLSITGVITYITDCHQQQAAEAVAIMNFSKNMFAFGLTLYSNDWIAIQGVRNCFFAVGGITTAVTCSTVFMYVWGKKARSLVVRRSLVG